MRDANEGVQDQRGRGGVANPAVRRGFPPGRRCKAPRTAASLSTAQLEVAGERDPEAKLSIGLFREEAMIQPNWAAVPPQSS